MEEMEVTTEVEAIQTDQASEEIVEEIEAEVAQEVEATQVATMREAKTGGLQDMKKKLPDWSLEPPETFLS